MVLQSTSHPCKALQLALMDLRPTNKPSRVSLRKCPPKNLQKAKAKSSEPYSFLAQEMEEVIHAATVCASADTAGVPKASSGSAALGVLDSTGGHGWLLLAILVC